MTNDWCSTDDALSLLLKEVSQCRRCADMPHEPRPVLSATATARILIIGQAPGLKVHQSGIPWDDPSGDRLRGWMGVSASQFYDQSQIAIIPMGFCYPGKGKSGDLPPRKECAPAWHQRLLAHLSQIELTLLIGQYAQHYYLSAPDRSALPAMDLSIAASEVAERSLTQRSLAKRSFTKQSLTERVKNWRDYLPAVIPLPHPSPRNRFWLQKNPWFEHEVVPFLRAQVADVLAVKGS